MLKTSNQLSTYYYSNKSTYLRELQNGNKVFQKYYQHTFQHRVEKCVDNKKDPFKKEIFLFNKSNIRKLSIITDCFRCT